MQWQQFVEGHFLFQHDCDPGHSLLWMTSRVLHRALTSTSLNTLYGINWNIGLLMTRSVHFGLMPCAGSLMSIYVFVCLFKVRLQHSEKAKLINQKSQVNVKVYLYSTFCKRCCHKAALQKNPGPRPHERRQWRQWQ